MLTVSQSTNYKGGMKTALGILKALADRNRLRVITALMGYNELCACHIAELLQVTGKPPPRFSNGWKPTYKTIQTSKKIGEL